MKDNNGSLDILAVNNIDIYGSRFNGYDMIDSIKKTEHRLNQIVTYKLSNNENVYRFYESDEIEKLEGHFRELENSILSTHSQFSIIGELLLNSEIFNKSNLIHYHMIHNTKIPLPALTHLFSLRPTVITIHDPWNFTGRCVHPYECEKWKSGCEKCDNLSSLFPFKLDNCNYMWRQKEKIAKEWDIDIIVSTNYLDETFVKKSPITKHFEHVHVLPFGVDLDLFKDKNNKKEIKKQFNIPDDDIVIFLRSQKDFKCASEIRQALEILQTDNSVTILTCSEIGNFDSLKKKYNIIDLGNITDEKIVQAFNACDFFLMPTKGETFGVMAIEAMACSRAVVVFDNMTLPQITFSPDCGVLVENLNVEKLAEAVKFLIDNEDERIRRGKLGRELAEKHYDVKIFNEKIINIYEKAYKRQNYKLSILKNSDIDYDLSNQNVKKLIYTIKMNYKLLFGNKIIKFNFDQKNFTPNEEFNADICEEIDYSDDEVCKFINYFNHTVYMFYKDTCYKHNKEVLDEKAAIDVITTKNKNKVNKLYYYAKHDRTKLKEAIKLRLNGNPKMYSFVKRFMFFIRRLKEKFN